jgi:SAM-dependent methyltransferase
MIRFARRIVKATARRLGIGQRISFGSLRRVQPVSRSFGLNRGRPIDRYYIESFINEHRADIRGRVLEAGGLVNYTRQFGEDRVTHADVLYPKEGHAEATIIGDLATGKGIPTATYDCIILTQVYPFIYDLRSAVENTFRALKPNGVLLATLPGISQICRYDMENWGDYWRFTDASVRALFTPVFGAESVSIETHGNVLVACAYLQGLAISDLKAAELDYNDPDYQLSITIRAIVTSQKGDVAKDSGRPE